MKRSLGHWQQTNHGRFAYKMYLPDPLPPQIPLDLDVLEAPLKRAKTALNNLSHDQDGWLQTILTLQEQRFSARLDGMVASLEGLLDPLDETGWIPDLRNSTQAAIFAHKELIDLPLSNRLLKMSHAIMFAGVRGDRRYPGEFRRSPNWVGAEGSSLAQAVYIPPDVDHMQELMGQLEQFLYHAELDPLIRIGLGHAQFHLILPFLVGNGEINRLAVHLWLIQEDLLKDRGLQLSWMFNRTKMGHAYFELLDDLSKNGDLEAWLEYFLEQLALAAQFTQALYQNMQVLYDQRLAMQEEKTPQLLKAWMAWPCGRVADVSRNLQIAPERAKQWLEDNQTLFSLTLRADGVWFDPDVVDVLEDRMF